MKITGIEIELDDDEVLIRTLPHEYPPPEKREGLTCVHSNGYTCCKCLRCGKFVNFDEWESGCETEQAATLNLKVIKSSNLT